MGQHSVPDAGTTGVIYLTPGHPQRRDYRGVRRRHSLASRVVAYLAAANPWVPLTLGACMLAAVDLMVVLYARESAGSFAAGFADIFASVFGLITGGRP